MWKSSVKDINGDILCVSQFTLMGSTSQNKPDFHKAMVNYPMFLSRDFRLTFIRARKLHERCMLTSWRFLGLLTNLRKSKVSTLLPTALSFDLISTTDGKFGAMMSVSLTNEVSYQNLGARK